ncbi:histidine kinase (plasmid) [Comamonadaceae bacterium OTU4NAUVB1]|nr:histidine kinase [Comamonadaceae bacterium OTU4NAUVB1]
MKPFLSSPAFPPAAAPAAPAIPAIPAGGETYLCATDDAATLDWLAHGLHRRGRVVPVACGLRAIDEAVATLRPQAVFLDFSGPRAATAAELHHQLRKARPDLPVLGTGASTEPAALLAALRAGVADFVDTAGSLHDLNATLVALLLRQRGATSTGAPAPARQSGARGHGVVLLGARPGLGVTTLATHLALLLQDAVGRVAATPAGGPPARGVALLDLGLPARDGLLYLDTASDFSFFDGVSQLRRLDQTLAQTALAHHADGLAVLPLSCDPLQWRATASEDDAALLQRLPDFFDHQVADLGGCTRPAFMAQCVREADRAWIVCDQSIGGLVSTAQLLRELEGHGIGRERIGLVVNLFDPALAVTARDMAQRLELPLAHVLPQRRAALLAAGARGQMLARVARHDPYVNAVQAMVRELRGEAGATAADGASRLPGRTPSSWAALVAPLSRRGRRARER